MDTEKQQESLTGSACFGRVHYHEPNRKTLWVIVVVKLVIMFFILKPFFFPNLLKSKYDNDLDKANHVRTELYQKAPQVSE